MLNPVLARSGRLASNSISPSGCISGCLSLCYKVSEDSVPIMSVSSEEILMSGKSTDEDELVFVVMTQTAYGELFKVLKHLDGVLDVSKVINQVRSAYGSRGYGIGEEMAELEDLLLEVE